jgi:hypothetical protein
MLTFVFSTKICRFLFNSLQPDLLTVLYWRWEVYLDYIRGLPVLHKISSLSPTSMSTFKSHWTLLGLHKAHLHMIFPSSMWSPCDLSSIRSVPSTMCLTHWSIRPQWDLPGLHGAPPPLEGTVQYEVKRRYYFLNHNPPFSSPGHS